MRYGKQKTKLTISGTSKKSIKNIEIAKTQAKNSTLIEKQKIILLKKVVHIDPSGSDKKLKPIFI